MTNTLTTYRRHAGLALLAGASLSVAGCIVAIVCTATSHVSTDLARAPMTHNAALVVYVMAATAEALFAAGLLWLRRSGLPRARAVTVGLGAAIAGSAVIAVCNAASIAIEDQLSSADGPWWVGVGFAAGSLLAVFGMIAAGLWISRHAREASWRDHAPLACGLASLILLPLGATNIVWLGIVVYAIAYAVLGASLLTAPSEHRQAAAQAHAA